MHRHNAFSHEIAQDLNIFEYLTICPVCFTLTRASIAVHGPLVSLIFHLKRNISTNIEEIQTRRVDKTKKKSLSRDQVYEAVWCLCTLNLGMPNLVHPSEIDKSCFNNNILFFSKITSHFFAWGSKPPFSLPLLLLSNIVSTLYVNNLFITGHSWRRGLPEGAWHGPDGGGEARRPDRRSGRQERRTDQGGHRRGREDGSQVWPLTQFFLSSTYC